MEAAPSATFPLVEAYRAELLASNYARLTDAELAHVSRRFAIAHHSNAMEGIHPFPETAALFAMFLQERVPVPLAEAYSDRHLTEHRVAAGSEVVLLERDGVKLVKSVNEG